MDAIIAFNHARQPKLRMEATWAIQGKALPKTQKTPPLWVAKAIRKFLACIVKLQARIDPKKPENRTMGSLLELEGMQMGLFSNLEKVSADIRGDPEYDENAERLIKAAMKDTATAVGPAIARQQRRVSRIVKTAAPAMPHQLRENAERLKKGIQSATDPNGNFPGLNSDTGKISLVLWVHWENFARLEKAKEVYDALKDMTDGNFSLKLVEKLCTEFGMFAGKRGRPAKKILRSAKFA